MRLQKQLSRVHKGKEYPKYVIVIPPTDIEKLGWKEGDELETEIKDGSIVVRLKNE